VSQIEMLADTVHDAEEILATHGPLVKLDSD